MVKAGFKQTSPVSITWTLYSFGNVIKKEQGSVLMFLIWCDALETMIQDAALSLAYLQDPIFSSGFIFDFI